MALPGTAPVAGQQPGDVGRRAAGGRAHRGDGHGRTAAARHHDAGCLPQRGHASVLRHRALDQLREAPAGDRARGRHRRRRVRTVRRATPTGCRCSRRPPERAGVIEELEAAGGARAVMKRSSSDLLDLDARTVDGRHAGRSAARRLPSRTRGDPHAVERPLRHRARPSSSCAGSLRPAAASCARSATGARTPSFAGRRTSSTLATRRSRHQARGDVQARRGARVRGLGVRRRSRHGLASAVVFALEGAGLGDTRRRDHRGQISGLVNKGTVVGEVSPEAAVGGPLGAAWRTATAIVARRRDRREVEPRSRPKPCSQPGARRSADSAPTTSLAAYRGLSPYRRAGAHRPSQGRNPHRKTVSEARARTPVIGEFDVVVVGGGPGRHRRGRRGRARRALHAPGRALRLPRRRGHAPAGCPRSAGCTPTCTASTGSVMRGVCRRRARAPRRAGRRCNEPHLSVRRSASWPRPTTSRPTRSPPTSWWSRPERSRCSTRLAVGVVKSADERRMDAVHRRDQVGPRARCAGGCSSTAPATATSPPGPGRRTRSRRRRGQHALPVDHVPHQRRRPDEGAADAWEKHAGAHGGGRAQGPPLPAQEADRAAAAQPDRVARQPHPDPNPDGSAVSGIDADQLTYGEIEGRRQCWDTFEFIPARRRASSTPTSSRSRRRSASARRGGCAANTCSARTTCSTAPTSPTPSASTAGRSRRTSRETWSSVFAQRGPRGFNQLPYRMIVPQKIDNLFVAGPLRFDDARAASQRRASRGPCFVMGQAAGTAAHLALQSERVAAALRRRASCSSGSNTTAPISAASSRRYRHSR